MAIQPFLHLPPPPPTQNPQEISAYLRRMWDALFRMRQGKLEAVTELTLTANAATTQLKWKGLSPQSVVQFDPKTANAAAEVANGTMYVLTANRGADIWTVTHANNAQTDRQFQVSVIG